jgi:MFS family permease
VKHGDQTRTQEPLMSRNFLLLVVGQLLQSIGYSTLPLLPLYLAFLGADRSEIGVATGVGAAGGLLVRPWVGVALDRWGRRPTLLTGTALLALATLGVAFVREVGFWLYVDRILFGLGIGCLFTGYFAFASDVIPASRRTEGIALFGIAGLFPLIVNPVASRLGLSGGTLIYVFPIAAVLIALSSIAVWLMREQAPAASSRPATGGDMFAAIGSRTLRSVWVAVLGFATMVAVFFSFATLAAKGRGVESATDLWFAYTAGAIAVRLVGRRVPDIVGTRNMVAPATAVYVVALILAASGQTWTAFMVSGVLAGVGHGYCFPVLISQVVARSDPSRRGASLSVFTALWDVALLLMTPIFGVVGEYYGDGVMFTSAANTSLALLVLWLILEWNNSRSVAPVVA